MSEISTHVSDIMTPVSDLAEALPQARRDFLHEVGDSANAIILDQDTYGPIVTKSATHDDTGRLIWAGLEVIFTKSPRRPVSLARTVHLFDDCESCRGL